MYTETRFPSQPPDVSYTWVWDSRPGFHLHAVINITWERPLGWWAVNTCSNVLLVSCNFDVILVTLTQWFAGYEYVTGYLLTLFSSAHIDCGDGLYRYYIHRVSVSVYSYLYPSGYPWVCSIQSIPPFFCVWQWQQYILYSQNLVFGYNFVLGI